MFFRRRSRVPIIAGRVVLAFVLLGLWEFAVRLGWIDHFFFSQPTDVAAQIVFWVGSGKVWRHLVATSEETLLAFIVGSILGAVVGFVLARNPWLADLLDPFIRLANAVPRVILAPIFLLWFGLGIWSKVALGVTVVFFVVFFNTYRGVREVPRVILDNARILGASEWQLTQHVLVPSAMSWIFSSLHISIGFSIIAAVVGEYLGASEGVGYLISQAQGRLDTTGVLAGLAILAVFVLVVSALVEHMERVLLRWKPRRSAEQIEI